MDLLVFERQDPDHMGYKRVDYKGLPPYLIEAVKALNIKIKKLEDQIYYLERKKGFDL